MGRPTGPGRARPRPGRWRFEHATVVGADPRTVWERVVTPAGINDELHPWLTMSPPAGHPDLTVDDVVVGEPLGRAPLRLFGLLPVDHDDLTVTELEPGRRFREESTMRSMRRWVHDRTVAPAGPGTTRVTDRVEFTPRLPLAPAGRVLRAVLAAFFRHRHRRLARHLGG